MSTFIELVQRLHLESGASGSPPTSVVSQAGETGRLVNWVRSADNIIQTRWHNWKYLYKQYSQSTGVGIETLQPPNDLNMWDYKTFRVNGEQVFAQEYDSIKHIIFEKVNGQPSIITINPDNSISFDPIPDAVYSVEADYFVKPIPLENNSDISKIPEQYHDAIVGRALIYYGNYESAPEVVEQGGQMYQDLLARLENHQLPNENYSRYNSSGNFIQVEAM